MAILQHGFTINNYTISTFIKDGEYNETYKITDVNGLPFFMKLYDPKRIPSYIYEENEIREIKLCKQLNHSNIISYITDGVVEIDCVEYPYLITNYFSGNLVADRINQGKLFSIDEVCAVLSEILEALIFMHDKNIVHNDITPRNIMFDEVTDGHLSAKLIDMGHAAYATENGAVFPINDLTPIYRAQETFYGKFLPHSDLFSLAATAYTMLTGKVPWSISLEEGMSENDIKAQLYTARKSSLIFPISIPEWLQHLLAKALSIKVHNRYSSAQEMKCALESKTENEIISQTISHEGNITEQCKKAATHQQELHRKTGNGFADVAGMEELKSVLERKVIFLLKDPEKAKRYKLTPPNGMILYGPPGCGKTYFAEKFAEESGFNYQMVAASDIGSTYIHGTQGKIAELFKNAEQNRPSVLCFDEFDAMAPKRESTAGEHQAGEVNEFLSQLNNCSQRGIFVIATTNKLELIDNAILRKGRLDMHIEIPRPDERTRKLMFDLYLKDRPCNDIDTQQLAKLTENYVASEIAYIVNDSAMQAAYADEAITQENLENCIRSNPPQATNNTPRRVGFQ